MSGWNNSAAVVMFALGFLCGWLVMGDTNTAATYSGGGGGWVGTPRNCRALIAENIDGWRRKEFLAENVLNSLDVHCGRYPLGQVGCLAPQPSNECSDMKWAYLLLVIVAMLAYGVNRGIYVGSETVRKEPRLTNDATISSLLEW